MGGKRIDEQTVKAIVEAYRIGESADSVALRYGCTAATVRACVRKTGGMVRGRGRPKNKVIDKAKPESVEATGE